MRITIKNIIIWSIGIIAVLLSLRAVFHPSFFPIHDFTHVARIVEMDKAIRDGHIPVRWVRDLGYGYGMPLFNFYGPIPFYLAEIAYAIGFSAITSIKLLLLFIGFSGYIGMYMFSKKWFGMLGGLLAAVAFTVIPYRAVDIFVRGAFNEVFAISCIPWCLYFIDELRRKITSKNIVLLSVSLLGLFTSHNLMTMMFLPFLYAFLLLSIFFSKNKKTFAVAAHLAFVLGISLSAFYLFPAFLEKGYTQVDKLIGGYGRYVFHFLYIRQFFTGTWGYGGSVPWPYAGMSFQLGWIHLILSALACFALLVKKKKTWFLFIGFFALSTGLGLFMTLYKSQFIWDRIPLLAYIQFPWRFLSISSVAIPVLCGASVLVIKKKVLRVAFVSVSIIALLLFNLRYYTPKEFLDNPDGVYYTDPVRIQRDMSGILPDYIPLTVKNLTAPSLLRVEVEENKIPWKYEVRLDRTQEMVVYIHDNNPSKLLFRIYAFPGWNVYIDGVKTVYSIDNDTGFIHVSIPAGEHIVTAVFENTPIRLVSNAISCISLVVLMGMFLYDRRSRNSA